MMMRIVTTLGIEQYGEFGLSAINNNGGSIKKCKNLLEFIAIFKKYFNTE
jgi:hypothetical protein